LERGSDGALLGSAISRSLALPANCISLTFVAAAFGTIGGSPASAGPADASCVYLALGCTAPTVHSIFDELSPSRPPYDVDLPETESETVRKPLAHHRHLAPRHRHPTT